MKVNKAINLNNFKTMNYSSVPSNVLVCGWDYVALATLQPLPLHCVF